MKTTALPCPSPGSLPDPAPSSPQAPMSNARPRFQLDLKRALIPISLGVCFLLYFYFHVPLPYLLIFMLWMPLYYLALPWYAGRQWHAFEREFAARWPLGDYPALLDLYRSRWFLRHFGPEARMLGKLGLIYIGMEQHREAEAVLERAVRLAQKADRERLLLNLAHVKFKLNRLDEAAQLYHRLLKKTPFLGTARTRLAIIEVHRGRHAEEARAWLRSALPQARGEERQLIEAALQLETPKA